LGEDQRAGRIGGVGVGGESEVRVCLFKNMIAVTN
jgi:hypothetical protein